MKLKNKIFHFSILIVFLLLSGCQNNNKKYIHNKGDIFGTSYHITYESPNNKDLQKGIESTLEKVNNSLSPFKPHSIISHINQNKDTLLDKEFTSVFNKAMEVSKMTNGAFDITVAPMVNTWGFGFKNKEKITPKKIDSLKQLVGYQKIKLVNGKIIKENKKTMLDCSAIAKGFACDKAGEYLKKEGCINYMVEIGGEVVARGVNDKNENWRIGISRPDDNNFFDDQKLKAILSLKNKALATSGNYRNYYIDEDGKKVTHEINPITGYPARQNMLSTTVLSNDCMTADAYATAFMVMGLDNSIKILKQNKDLEVYFIYSDKNLKTRTYISDGFKKFLIKDYK
ncbi:MAG: FAD:protein FMN transferase [Prolixibacteraceae bacterium]|nr:FAD:protein FMN transferase [Prolixibacteraceae bacterium]